MKFETVATAIVVALVFAWTAIIIAIFEDP